MASKSIIVRREGRAKGVGQSSYPYCPAVWCNCVVGVSSSNCHQVFNCWDYSAVNWLFVLPGAISHLVKMVILDEKGKAKMFCQSENSNQYFGSLSFCFSGNLPKKAESGS